ncbi:MAG: hypothetical protein PHW13_11905 [Methylococcales bacterium]|nr:hypothetical protein [Methylococcales bacterium]
MSDMRRAVKLEWGQIGNLIFPRGVEQQKPATPPAVATEFAQELIRFELEATKNRDALARIAARYKALPAHLLAELGQTEESVEVPYVSLDRVLAIIKDYKL